MNLTNIALSQILDFIKRKKVLQLFTIIPFGLFYNVNAHSETWDAKFDRASSAGECSSIASRCDTQCTYNETLAIIAKKIYYRRACEEKCKTNGIDCIERLKDNAKEAEDNRQKEAADKKATAERKILVSRIAGKTPTADLSCTLNRTNRKTSPDQIISIKIWNSENVCQLQQYSPNACEISASIISGSAYERLSWSLSRVTGQAELIQYTADYDKSSSVYECQKVTTANQKF